jgi:hypothetical protein
MLRPVLAPLKPRWFLTFYGCTVQGGYGAMYREVGPANILPATSSNAVRTLLSRVKRHPVMWRAISARPYRKDRPVTEFPDRDPHSGQEILARRGLTLRQHRAAFSFHECSSAQLELEPPLQSDSCLRLAVVFPWHPLRSSRLGTSKM